MIISSSLILASISPPLAAGAARRLRGHPHDADGNARIHDAVTIRWTFDERIHDGFYCAATLELLRGYVEDPASLGISAPGELRAVPNQPPALRLREASSAGARVARAGRWLRRVRL